MLDLHPLCTLFPRMTGSEFDALVADIRANGLRQPIVLHEGLILDGGNRYRACIAAEVDPEFVSFEGGNLVAFVLSANLHRRHMTAGQQAAIVASAQDWAQAQQSAGRPKIGAAAPISTTRERAAQSGASVDTQKRADKVARADPALAREVAHGNVSLPAAVEQITGKRPGAKAKDSEREQVEHDAFGDFDPVAELESAQKEIHALQVRIDALQVGDTAAELDRQVGIRQGIEARLAQEMSKSSELDKQLRKLGKVLETLRKLTGASTNAEIVEAVRGMVKKAA